MWSTFWNGLGELFSAIWTIMPTLGNIPNVLAVIVISVLFHLLDRKISRF